MVISGCSRQPSLPGNTSTFVDISEFTSSELNWLTSEQPDLLKRSNWQGTSKTDTLNHVDWEKELYPFLELNIKPTVWSTDFTLSDSMVFDNKIIRTYRTTNPRQRVKEFQITTLMADGSIERLEATIEDHTRLTSSNQQISLTRGVGYSLAGLRKTKMLGNEDYQLIGQYLTKNND